MKVSEAVVAYLQSEIVPHIAGESELTAAILNGAMRAGRKRLADKLGDMEMLRSIGITDESGNADPEFFREFMEGMFEGREKVSVSLAELLKLATGVESASPLLADKLTFTKGDADKFLSYLTQ